MADIEEAKKDFLPPPGWKRNPILLKLKKLDEALSYRLTFAYDESSCLGAYRRKLVVFERSAHTLICFGVALLFWWMSASMESRAVYTNIILALCIDVFVVAIVKSMARRRRPGVTKSAYDNDPSSTNLSFPSGFVSRATLLALILASEGFSPISLFLFLLWAGAMLLTKLFLGRFFLGDALGAVPLGYLTYQFIDLVWLDADDVIAMEAFFGGQLGD
ncbi:phospholipid phosphatase 6 [Galendromus occidentalis]|uniref:Phospholipid phosphatase 6 n=1 Tax=Galendromus occidentalis TaxID=34638 RepID=A0AAJ6QN30_9ACAR|nr:phospholipid phosphatase 6 [Galendromus occidentalis]